MAKKTRKRQRRPEARPDEILDAALTIFSEKGFAEARMDDVANKAGLSKGSLYLYFNSKEQLFEALVRRFAATFAHVMAERVTDLSSIDPLVALRTAIVFIFTTISDPKTSAAPRLVFSEAQRFPEIAALYRREVINIGKAAIQSVLEEGQRRGIFRRVSHDAAIRTIFGPIIAHMFLSHIFIEPNDPPPPPANQMAHEIADCVLRGIGVTEIGATS